MDKKVDIIKDGDSKSIVVINDLRFKRRRSVDWKIEIATNKTFAENYAKKYNTDARFGWYRYMIRILQSQFMMMRVNYSFLFIYHILKAYCSFIKSKKFITKQHYI